MNHNIDFSLHRDRGASKLHKSLHQGVTEIHEDAESHGNSSNDEAYRVPEDMSDYVSRMECISEHLKKFVEYLRPTQKNVYPLVVASILKDFEEGNIVLESDSAEAAVNEKRLDDEVLPGKTRVVKGLPGELRLENMMNCIVQVADLGIDYIFDVTSDPTDKRAFTTLKTVLEIAELPARRQSDLFLYMQTIGNALYAMTLNKNNRESTSFIYTVSALSIMAEMTTRSGYVLDIKSGPEPADFFLSFNTLIQYFMKNGIHASMMEQIVGRK